MGKVTIFGYLAMSPSDDMKSARIFANYGEATRMITTTIEQ
jgi:hypothetical protein